jgi:hypothetical protein
MWTTILGAVFLVCHDSWMVWCLATRGYFAQAVRILCMNNFMRSSDNVIWNSTLHLRLKFIYTAQLSNMLTYFHCNNFIIVIPCRSALDLPPNTNAEDIVRHEAEALSEWMWFRSTLLFSIKSVSATQNFCFWQPTMISLWKLFLTKQRPYMRFPPH